MRSMSNVSEIQPQQSGQTGEEGMWDVGCVVTFKIEVLQNIHNQKENVKENTGRQSHLDANISQELHFQINQKWDFVDVCRLACVSICSTVNTINCNIVSLKPYLFLKTPTLTCSALLFKTQSATQARPVLLRLRLRLPWGLVWRWSPTSFSGVFRAPSPLGENITEALLQFSRFTNDEFV